MLKLWLMLISAIMIFSPSGFAGKTELTTYYPAPHGEYKNLYTTEDAAFATTSGKVGIGTVSPKTALQIGESDSGAKRLTIAGDATGKEGGQIDLEMSGDYDTAAYEAWHLDVYEDDFRIFLTGSEKVRVTSSGDVGIGTWTPSSKLHVNGDITCTALWGTGVGSNPSGGRIVDRGGDNVFSVDWTGAAPLKFYIEDVNVKNFIVQHPREADRYLIHTTLEGPENAVFYRGTSKLNKGVAEILLPDYFEALTQQEGRTVLLTPRFVDFEESVSPLAASGVKDGKFLVKAINKDNPAQEFDWEVKAIRKDVKPLWVEPRKDQVEVQGVGPYKYYSIKDQTIDS